ncbi:MAG: hypothetical protein Q9190_001020 [Brigantiaea leucoxantha]
MSTLDIQIKNQTSANQPVFVSITGLAIDKNNALFLLSADAKSPYYPSQPSHDQASLSQDCAIHLGPPGSTITASVPRLAGSRIYFSIGKPLSFALNRGPNDSPALVAPSIDNPTDPNTEIQWAFCEFTFDSSQLFCNISYVDFVGLPIALDLATKSGQQQTVTGIPADGLEQISKKLKAQSQADRQPWDQLVVRAQKDGEEGNDRPIRILSPNAKILSAPRLFQGYYEPYVDKVWSKYSHEDMHINTQNGTWGTLKGRVLRDDKLTFGASGQTEEYAFSPPSTADVFSCSSGPFNLPNNEYGNVGARIAAGLNRSVLLEGGVHPDGIDAKEYYCKEKWPTNHYSRVVHEVNRDGLGYAFPYDDVTGGDGMDQSGKVATGSGDVKRFTVSVGGGNNVLESKGRAEL